MGGELEMRSRDGGGSVFFFTASFGVLDEPTGEITAGTRTAQDCSASADDTLQQPLRVMLADDQIIHRRLLARRLEKLLPSAEFTHAESGESALELLLHGDFDVALLDEHYGTGAALTGTQVTRRFREHERSRAADLAEGHRLIVVGVTGNESEQHNAFAAAAGQDCVWGKPAPDTDALAHSLRRLLSARAAASARAPATTTAGSTASPPRSTGVSRQ